VEIGLKNVYVPIQFQGHRAKVKVMAAKNGRAQVCAPLEHSLFFEFIKVRLRFDNVLTKYW